MFKRPRHALLISVALGSGVQIVGVFYMVLFATLFGLYGPNARSIIMLLVVGGYPMFGFLNGFISARFYKFF